MNFNVLFFVESFNVFLAFGEHSLFYILFVIFYICSYLISGDADGKCFVWDWKTSKLLTKWKAHDKVCISVLWHPHETSKVATAGWDGLIKFWD